MENREHMKNVKEKTMEILGWGGIIILIFLCLLLFI